MRLSYFFITFLLLSGLFVHAKDSTLTWFDWKKTWLKEKLILKNIQQQHDSNQIKTIDVLDMRSDTGSLGLYTTKSQRPHAVVADVSLSTLLNSKLANNSTGNQLLFVIKSFWINEANIFFKQGGVPTGYIEATGNSNLNNYLLLSNSKINCGIDVFIFNDGKYYPLTRFDTIMASFKKVNSSSEDLVDDVFYLLNKKLSRAIYANRYLLKKPGDKESIRSNYSNRFNIAALTDVSIKKGVYTTWEQFKNNQPDNKEFRIQINKKEPPTLYVKDEHGTEILTRQVFAVSNGTKAYKVHQGFVFDMYRDRQSIYWMGVEEFNSKTQHVPVFALLPGVAVFGSEAVGTKLKIQLRPYLLNIETGQEY